MALLDAPTTDAVHLRNAIWCARVDILGGDMSGDEVKFSLGSLCSCSHTHARRGWRPVFGIFFIRRTQVCHCGRKCEM